uniref:Phosphatidylinositol N-acetylglucosaminyltransferase subunit C n=2 Tax=Babesia bovis TaxID=5865 RepID=S6B0S5_BABBO|nr:hypothetical protein [Babesia bovis]
MLTDVETKQPNLPSKKEDVVWENESACGTVKEISMLPWERVMYKRQAYPPNYVSSDFLRGLSENGSNCYTLWDLCPKTMMLTQHCSTMLLMARMFLLIKDDVIPLEYVEGAAVPAIISFCIVMYLTKATLTDRFQHIRFALKVHFTLQILQPVLQTLTSSFTYDTIYALAIMVSLISIFTQDYGITGNEEIYVKSADTLPMNCLIVVAILISSRFGCSQKATAYMQLYVMTFMMLPLLQRFMMTHNHTKLVYLMTLGIIILTSWCLYCYHIALVPVYMLGNIIVNVIGPLVYIYAQKYKRNVSGPWNPDQVPHNRNCN